jgi:site-specific DNA recombinase
VIEDHSRRGEYGRPAVIGVKREIVQEEAAVLLRMFEMYANGWSEARIAKQFNKEGVPNRPSRPWQPTGVRARLRNEKYRGLEIWNRT